MAPSNSWGMLRFWNPWVNTPMSFILSLRKCSIDWSSSIAFSHTSSEIGNMALPYRSSIVWISWYFSSSADLRLHLRCYHVRLVYLFLLSLWGQLFDVLSDVRRKYDALRSDLNGLFIHKMRLVVLLLFFCSGIQYFKLVLQVF